MDCINQCNILEFKYEYNGTLNGNTRKNKFKIRSRHVDI